jgi:menaquinone-dependent protoporphyrinogen oxidase
MPRILVVHASFDGQTARIAEHMARVLRAAGHDVTLRGVDALEVLWETQTHDAVIVGGAVRYGRHAAALEQMVRDRLEDLASRPCAFYSVCMSAARTGNPDVAKRYREDFLRRTRWKPALSESFPGALPYSRYSPFLRFMMRLIAGVAGGDTDTSRDYEYTDWKAVERFAERFAALVAPRARRIPAAALVD